MKSEIILGDCLDVMSAMQPETFDAIITDPPYGIDFQSNRRIDANRVSKHEYIANDEAPFLDWIPDAFRLAKRDSSLICFCRWDVQEAFRVAISDAGFTIKSQIVWDREWHGMGDLKAQFAPRHDVAWFATKGDFAFTGTRPMSVIRASRPAARESIHPTEKPLGLMKKLVDAVVPHGGSVLDPFSGSGSTVHAAIETGRIGVGIELNPTYFNHSVSRKDAALAALQTYESFFE